MTEQTLVVGNDMVVSMDYTLTVDGEIMDSSRDGAPLQYLQGYRNIISGLEKGVAGMAVGESRTVLVAPAEAYGEYDAAAFLVVERQQFPEGFPLEQGRTVRLRAGDGSILTAWISNIGDTEVRLDLNHPLAGKELSFDVTIVDIRAATNTELANGRLGGGCSSCGSSSEGCGSDGCGSGSEGCGSGCCG